MASTLLDPNDPETFTKCASFLSSGGCVAFPTETVYGLGANALSIDAVLSIFRFKGRPLTDPLIVHCKDSTAAKELVILDDIYNDSIDHVLEDKDDEEIINNKELEVDENDQSATEKSIVLNQPSASSIAFDHLAASFWPGPLTLVAKAVERIPNEVTAETGYVGVRVPKHPIAMALLQACGLPIAAPSANRFGHVSPTSAKHVFEDLGHHPILILQEQCEGKSDDDNINDLGKNLVLLKHNNNSSSSSCAVGIESTVAKIEGFDSTILRQDKQNEQEKDKDENGIEGRGRRIMRRRRQRRSVKITILRKGGVSATEIRNALAPLTSLGIKVSVDLASLPSSTSTSSSSSAEIPSSSSSTTTTTVVVDDKDDAKSLLIPSPAHQAPGMLLSHYAPDIPAYLVTTDPSRRGGNGGGDKGEFYPDLKSSVVVDFNGRLIHLKESTLEYRDLSQMGSPEEACRVVFETLRWAECVSGATSVLITDPSWVNNSEDIPRISAPGDRLDALRDRLFRAASGHFIQL
jgi:tRNA A37 threonylcarbamoyladenosine synthetase subunit TsaC/SUA5/YrdC